MTGLDGDGPDVAVAGVRVLQDFISYSGLVSVYSQLPLLAT